MYDTYLLIYMYIYHLCIVYMHIYIERVMNSVQIHLSSRCFSIFHLHAAKSCCHDIGGVTGF